jgi:mono/diheme cytochrome c family protein
MISKLCVLLLAAIALAALTPAAGLARDADGFVPADPLAGRLLFSEKHCIRCHSIQGVGGKTGPDLGEVWLGSFMDIASKLWDHFPRMNEAFKQERLERPTLTADEARQLITFLYFLNYFDKTANPEVGAKLFQEKNCIRCHSVGGKGGDVGPALDPFQGRYAAPFITAALWDHGPKMMQKMLEKNVPRPEFQDRDVIDILAFIRVNGLYDKADRSYLPPGDPSRGQALFQSKGCIRCHSINGKGGTIGPDLGKRTLKGSLSYILSQMWNHGARMWPEMARRGVPFPRFSPREMSDLMTYLYFLEFQDPPGSAARGRQVFAEKQCVACHQPESPNVKTIGPNLAQLGLTSPFEILAQMWNHAPAIEARMSQGGIRWPLLDKTQMRDLVEYIVALNRKH